MRDSLTAYVCAQGVVSCNLSWFDARHFQQLCNLRLNCDSYWHGTVTSRPFPCLTDRDNGHMHGTGTNITKYFKSINSYYIVHCYGIQYCTNVNISIWYSCNALTLVFVFALWHICFINVAMYHVTLQKTVCKTHILCTTLPFLYLHSTRMVCFQCIVTTRGLLGTRTSGHKIPEVCIASRRWTCDAGDTQGYLRDDRHSTFKLTKFIYNIQTKLCSIQN